MKKQFLECGKIVSTHGIRGEMKVQPWCDGPEFLLEFPTLYLKGGEEPLRVRQARVQKNMVLLLAEGIDTVEAASALRGQVLFLNREDAPEDDGWFIQDLLGMEAVDADTGKSWGKLTDVIFTGANDVYELTGEDGVKRLIPVIPQVVLETDVEGGVLKIRPLKGLFEDAD